MDIICVWLENSQGIAYNHAIDIDLEKERRNLWDHYQNDAIQQEEAEEDLNKSFKKLKHSLHAHIVAQ